MQGRPVFIQLAVRFVILVLDVEDFRDLTSGDAKLTDDGPERFRIASFTIAVSFRVRKLISAIFKFHTLNRKDFVKQMQKNMNMTLIFDLTFILKVQPFNLRNLLKFPRLFVFLFLIFSLATLYNSLQSIFF